MISVSQWYIDTDKLFSKFIKQCLHNLINQNGIFKNHCSWVQQIFSIGNKRPLTEDDIFPIEPRLRSERLTALLEQ